MALIPYALRPQVIIRRKALRSGLLGNSLLWKGVAVWVFGKGTIKAVFGKHPEHLGTFRLGQGAFLRVANMAPTSKKEQRRTGRTKSVIVAEAVRDVEAARPGKGVRTVG